MTTAPRRKPTQINTTADDTGWQQNLCSVSEIARLMGVSKGRVSQYTAAKWFPKHLDKLDCGRVWWYPDVLSAWTAHKAKMERHRPPTGYAADDTPEETP